MYVYQHEYVILLWQFIIRAKNIMKWIAVYTYCIYSYIPVLGMMLSQKYALAHHTVLTDLF